tara:strand:+ start:773 stop:1435 length:663 start_codon:yes stop_codon:yes gene_type:complete
MIELLSSNISHRLNEILLEKDVKKSELASILNVDASVVSGWISGKRILTMKSRSLIADKLKIDVNEISDFTCEIPIVGYAEYNNYRIIDAKVMDKIQSLKVKNAILPKGMQAIKLQHTSDYNWRRDLIWLFKNTIDSSIQQKRVHRGVDFRLCICETAHGIKYLAEVRKTLEKDRYTLHAVVGGEPLANCIGIELNWACPVYCSYANHDVLETSFVNSLD